MSVMLALAACGGGAQPLISKTYTASQTITIPAGVSNLVLVSGQGAAGQPSYQEYLQHYTKKTTTYNQRNDAGGETIATDQGTVDVYNQPTPADYCEEKSPYVTNGVTNYTWNCFDFTDMSFWYTNPATTGAAATGFGQTFPGGVGGPATSRSFDNVAVTPGQTFQLVIPAGGSITISYY